jgi:tetratricopeptide (TPR) repeat protein
MSLQNAGAAVTGFGSASGITLDDPLPTRLSAGISYRIFKPLTLTVDFRQPLNLSNLSESEQWSAGTGAIVQVTDFFAVLGGFLIQGANPRISLGSEFDLNKVRMNVNYTFDLTSSVNPVNHISLSAKINFGDRGRQKKSDEVDEYYQQGLAYYADGRLEKAVEEWKKALAIDKRFDPAIEGIKTAETSLQLYQRILEIQSLE